MTTILALLAVAPTMVQGVTQERGDVQMTTFNLPQGKVTVYLPDDMRAGDTISGTVVAEPKGTGKLALDNGAVLTGLVVELEGQKPKRRGESPSWLLPAGIAAVGITLVTSDGHTVGTSSCPTLPADVAQSPTSFGCDPIANAGAPIQIQGPFDGDSANTKASVGSSDLVPLAETPRSCVFAGVPPNTGPAEIQVEEGGQTTTLHSHVVRMTLAARKTTLLRGERTTLEIKVTGLEGLPDSAYPIPCELVNETPQIVHVSQPGSTAATRGETYAFPIQRSDAKAGIATFNIGLTGVQPGAFLMRGICFAVSMHDVKKAMNVATFRAWVKGLIASYEARIKALEAEEAKDPDRGRRLNIARKKNILEVLKAFRNAGNNDIGVAKIAVDKALADDAFFAMAAELITTAAEMLGYTDIPMPGIGSIVGGIKAIAGAAKLTKALKALETVEKLIEEYNKLTDAKDKVEKAGKIKDALDKVKEAIDAGE